VMLLQQTSKL